MLTWRCHSGLAAAGTQWGCSRAAVADHRFIPPAPSVAQNDKDCTTQPWENRLQRPRGRFPAVKAPHAADKWTILDHCHSPRGPNGCARQRHLGLSSANMEVDVNTQDTKKHWSKKHSTNLEKAFRWKTVFYGTEGPAMGEEISPQMHVSCCLSSLV